MGNPAGGTGDLNCMMQSAFCTAMRRPGGAARHGGFRAPVTAMPVRSPGRSTGATGLPAGAGRSGGAVRAGRDRVPCRRGRVTRGRPEPAGRGDPGREQGQPQPEQRGRVQAVHIGQSGRGP